MKIYLAPMEGVIDSAMRECFTLCGGIDVCFSEFLRVTDSLLSPKNFYDVSPELNRGGCTSNGTDVYVQLMGKHPDLVAQNAHRAVTLGAKGIDLNFGCPSNTVNRHGCGAVLLESPEVVHAITAAVRQAITPATPLSAKIRLGYKDDRKLLDNLSAIKEGGADWVTIHARTKVEMYRSPAHWEKVGEAARRVPIPIVINGDIWTLEDFIRCRQLTGISDVMLGRGLLVQPNLAAQIKAYDGANAKVPPFSFLQIVEMLLRYVECVSGNFSQHYGLVRLKQWLNFLAHLSQEQTYFSLFDRIKRLHNLAEAQRELLNVLSYQNFKPN